MTVRCFVSLVGCLVLLALPASGAPSLSLNQRTIAVSIAQGRANHPKDWVGLYRVDVDPATRVTWKYLSGSQTPPSKGKTSATLYFSLPTGEGAYELRLYADGQASQLLARSPVMTRGLPTPACHDALLNVCGVQLSPSGLMTTFE